MATERCPRCKRVRNMRVSVAEREERQPDGSRKRFRTTNFHCETCGNRCAARFRELEVRAL